MSDRAPSSPADAPRTAATRPTAGATARRVLHRVRRLLGAHAVGRGGETASVTRAATLCGLAVGVALAAADRARTQHAAAVDAALRAEAPRAAVAESLHARLMALDAAERASAALVARREDPLAPLAALSERLPVTASVTRVRATGGEWRIEGTAADADAVAPALAGDARFARVRPTAVGGAPSTDDPGSGQPFALAFRARPEAASPPAADAPGATGGRR